MDKVEGENNLNFKEFIQKNKLNESPVSTGVHLSSDMDSINGNYSIYQSILDNSEIDGHIIFNGKKYDLYLERSEESKPYWFVDINQPHLHAYFSYKPTKHGYTCNGMWKLKSSDLRMNWILLEHFLPQLKLIFSDTSLTDKGITFWTVLIEDNINNLKYSFGIYYISKDEFIEYKKFEDFNDDKIWTNSDIKIWAKLNSK